MQSIRDFVLENQLMQSEKIFENEKKNFTKFVEQFSITITQRKFKKRATIFFIDRETRIFKSKISRSDYDKLQNLRQFQLKKRANVINNTYNVKQISRFHIHMIRVLHALNNDENFDFDHISKFLNYREVRKSFH